MRAIARRSKRQRVAAALAAAVFGTALLASSLAVAGELAVLHSVLAEDTVPDQTSTPCKGPVGVPCSPGIGDAPRPPEPPRVSRIGVEMTPCYLGCPAFTAIFSADGSFSYVGEMNVEHLGEHTGRVDVAKLHQVMRLAEEVGFVQLDDTYATPFLDNPSSYVMVEWPSETKVVRADGGAEPIGFWAVRELLRDLLDEAEWDAQ
ncbi:MAG TPA: DUF6438 domain-containing protein [Trueperaceae bacterium]|nr:DUF6438 domain-containing protein [Trueperaceae bacterium]